MEKRRSQRGKSTSPWQDAVRRHIQAVKEANRHEEEWAALAGASFRLKFEASEREFEAFRLLADQWHSNYVETQVSRPGGGYEQAVRATQSFPLVAEDHLGHAIEDARSSLEHLAYALAERNGPLSAQEKRDVSFPISMRHLERNDKRVAKMSASVMKTLERVQPYTANPDNPADSPLALLDDLAQNSKHRTRIVLTAAHGVSTRIGDGIVDSLIIDRADLGKINEWQRVLYSGPGSRANLEVEPHVSLTFDLPDARANGRDVIRTMEEIYSYIRRQVFRPLVPHVAR